MTPIVIHVPPLPPIPGKVEQPDYDLVYETDHGGMMVIVFLAFALSGCLVGCLLSWFLGWFLRGWC